MNPEEELKRINRLIRQFEAVFKSTGDPYQKDRVGSELKKLRTYRKKLESFHEMDPAALEEDEGRDMLEPYPFLRQMLDRRDGTGGAAEEGGDQEIDHVALYLSFFEKEFLALLSETRLKLDFKFSLERDSFYHRFENVRRLLKDYEVDAESIDLHQGKHQEEDMRRRRFKKQRNLLLEVDRLFRSLLRFAADLIEDIGNEGLMCLNADEVIQFEALEGSRYLEGLKVEEGLQRLHDFCRELISYLNVPQMGSQER